MRKGKKLLLLVTAIIALTVCMAFGVSAETEYTEGNYTYIVTDGKATVTDYDGEDKNVIIPDTLGGYSVTAIGDEAFYYCNSLESIILPDSLISIGESAFGDCESLETITIGDRVTSIGRDAFRNTAYYNDEANWENGLLYIDKHLINSYYRMEMGDIIIKDGTLTLADQAMWNVYANSITIPDSVVSLGYRCFEGCNSKNYIIGKGLKEIGEGCFYNFYNSFYTESITIDEENPYLTIDENGNIYNKDKTELLMFVPIKGLYCDVDEGIQKISSKAFTSCWEVQTIILPDSVSIIEDDAFFGTYELDFVYYSGGEDEWINISKGENNDYLLNAKINYNINNVYDLKIEDYIKTEKDGNAETSMITDFSVLIKGNITLPEVIDGITVTSVGYGAFRDCNSVEEITVPDSYTETDFSGCTGLKRLNLGKSVQDIDYDSFYGSTGIENINVDIENPYYYSDEYGVLLNKEQTEIIYYPPASDMTVYDVPETVTMIGYYNFRNMKNLQTLNIHVGVTEINMTEAGVASAVSPFESLSLVNINVDADNPMFTSVGGVLFDKEMKTLLKYPDGKENSEYTVPDGVETFADGSFRNSINLEKVIIPKSVSSLGYFSFCSGPLTIQYLGTEEEWINNVDKCYNPGFDYGLTMIYDKEDPTTKPGTDPHTHTYTSTTKAPTCTTTGTTTYTCSCGDTYTETIKAKGHTVVTDKAVAATCTKTGLTAGSHCSECNAVITKQNTVAKKAHTSDKGTITKKATYKTTGTKTYKCTVCKTTLKTEKIAKLKLGKVTGLKVKAVKLATGAKTTLTLSWTKTTGAEKYEVQQYVNKKWKTIKTTEKTSLTVKKLKANKTYKFRVRALVDGVKGAYSKTLSAKTVPLKTTLSLKAGKKQLTANWKTVANITGYEITYSTSKKFTKKTTKIVTVKKAKTKKTTLKKLKSGKKYYVKVRAYKTVNGKKIYGSYSSVKTVKVK